MRCLCLIGCLFFLWACGSTTNSREDKDATSAPVSSPQFTAVSYPTDTVYLAPGISFPIENRLQGSLAGSEYFAPCPPASYNSMVPETFAMLDERLEVEAFRKIQAVYALDAGWKTEAEPLCFRLFQLEFPDLETAHLAAKASPEIWERGVGFKLSMEWDWFQRGNRIYWIDALSFTRKSETMEVVKQSLEEVLTD